MFKSILLSKKYWISVVLLGLGFMVLYSAIEHFMQYGEIAVASFKRDKIADNRWIRYVISRMVGGLMYGMIMAYYFEKRKRKAKQ